MGTYSNEQIKDIIIKQPNKTRIEAAQKTNKKLLRHLEGIGLSEAIERDDACENTTVYGMRKKGAISNKDMLGRVLQEEDIIFSTRGGSANFNLSPDDEKKMNRLLDNVNYGMSLRKWIRNFALKAYRADPMGVIFMEVEETFEFDGSPVKTPKCYPIYKSIQDIHDYDPNGRMLEYICFRLTKDEIISFGISDRDAKQENANYPNVESKSNKTNYYRFIDDNQDIIVKVDNDTLVVVTSMQQANPIANKWGMVPAFIVSDLINFTDPKSFSSPLHLVDELCDCYLFDRSVKDLQKKYHGFAKAVEPLLKCTTCGGEGNVKGNPCPNCTLPGHSTGTGYNLQTKLGDVAKFPLELITAQGAPSFDYNKIFGYVTPDIESWVMQVQGLEDGESFIYYTYWGTAKQGKANNNGSGKLKNDQHKTATETLANQQPKYARLNMTTDWAERTENLIAYFIGKFWFEEAFKSSGIIYSRNFILETPQDLAEDYYEMCAKGAPEEAKDEAYERWLRALYQSQPNQLAKYLKMMRVIPFPHQQFTEIESSNFVTISDKLAKRYGNEWMQTLTPDYIYKTKEVDMRKDLDLFTAKKQAMLLPIEGATTETIQVKDSI